MDPWTIASLGLQGLGAIGSLFGLGKGKELPRESPNVTAQRDKWMSYLMDQMRSAPQRRTQAMQGMKMPSRTKYLNDPMNLLWSSYLGKGFTPSPNTGGMNPFDILYGGQGRGNALAAMTNPGMGMQGGMGGPFRMPGMLGMSGGMGGGMPGMGGFRLNPAMMGMMGGGGMGMPGMGGMSGRMGGNPWARFSMGGQPYSPMGR